MNNETIDASCLPQYGYGAQSPMWWGTMGFMIVEGMGFLLAAAMYFYLAAKSPEWPLGAHPPKLGPGSLQTALLLISLVPNLLLDRAAKREELGNVRKLLIVLLVMELIAIVLRFYEFQGLGIRWDVNAYGSVAWLMLGLHMTHLITDCADSAVLTVLMFTRHAKGKRFSDVSDTAFYWYFVVFAWVPIYVLIYWVPRLT